MIHHVNIFGCMRKCEANFYLRILMASAIIFLFLTVRHQYAHQIFFSGDFLIKIETAVFE